jgi:hypothetical protein
MRQIVIFGTGDMAELADFYFTNDSAYQVAGFAVDAAFRNQAEFRGRPVVAFEDVGKEFPPDRYGMFVAVGYSKVNAVRAGKLAAARARGYRIATYVSSRATVFPVFEPKENCFILEDNTIQPFASIGANVTLWSTGACLSNSCWPWAAHVSDRAHSSIAGFAPLVSRLAEIAGQTPDGRLVKYRDVFSHCEYSGFVSYSRYGQPIED